VASARGAAGLDYGVARSLVVADHCCRSCDRRVELVEDSADCDDGFGGLAADSSLSFG